MQKIKVIDRVGFTARLGRLRLSTAQAASRSHALRHLEDDLYEIISPVSFKLGEVLEWDGEINKTLADVVEPPDSTTPTEDDTDLAPFSSLSSEDRVLVIAGEIRTLRADGTESVSGPDGKPVNVWTRDGKASVPALEAVLGESITGQERDEAQAIADADPDDQPTDDEAAE